MKEIIIPKDLLKSKYRKDMWKEVLPSLQKMLECLPVEEIHVIGSFSSKKRRPADVDFMVLFKIKPENKKAKWSFDFVVAPNNAHGQFVYDDVKTWMKQKYGSKNFKITQIY